VTLGLDINVRVITIENEAAMTATITTSAFDCGRAQIRPHCRHLATVVTIDGDIDGANVDQVISCARRFVLAKEPLVFDMSNVNSFAVEGVSLVRIIAEDCRTAGVEWILVPSPAVADVLCDADNDALFPVARSVHEALHDFADVIDRRRQLLLPLVRKTA
jgi:anti-anti-sigma regulatory factor